ncbi:hypothetical protein [Arthrobacter sp. UYCo732]|uniref:hypothetical protein n=1 Tax=Arthrobacter sp. UYCo732 TaxID=3156336 RepID=UPI0033973373
MTDFAVTSTITFRPLRVPPRCRKPRPVVETFKHEFVIPCVSSEQAPVVALVPDDRGYYGTTPGEDAPLRAHAGKLYTAEMRGRQPVRAGSAAFPAKDSHESWQAWEYEAINEAGRRFQDILIIDGEVWKLTPEPAYAIVTMGLGGNHGGTYLEIDYAGRYSRQYALTDYDAAVEAAVAFATKRGDTNTIGIIRKTPKATILDPSAFKIPSETDTLAAARSEVIALAAKARDILSGTLTRASLTEAKDLAEKAASVFWQHDLEEFIAE